MQTQKLLLMQLGAHACVKNAGCICQSAPASSARANRPASQILPLCLPFVWRPCMPLADCLSMPIPHAAQSAWFSSHADVTHLGSPLGTKSLGENGVGEAGDVGVALLDNGDGENRDVGADDAASNGLSDSLSGSSGAVARVSLGEEEADSVCLQDTLLHGEAAASQQRDRLAKCTVAYSAV